MEKSSFVRKVKKILFEDEHSIELVQGAVLAFVIRVVGSGLAFVLNVVIARMLGAHGAGLYFLALSVTTIASVIARVGLDNALLRFIAAKAVLGDWVGVVGVYRLGMRLVLITGSAVTVALFFLSPWVATAIFGKFELAVPMRWMTFSILPVALLNLQAESLKGLKRIRDAMLIQGIGVPLTMLVFVIPLVHLMGVLGAVWAYVAGSIIVASAGVWSWRRQTERDVSEQSVSDFTFIELWSSCRPLFVISVMNRAILPWAPLFLLGIWCPSKDVGIFGVALRVAMLVSFTLAAVNNVVAPKFAELYAKHDIEALGQTARRSALLVTFLASPLFVVLILGARWVMSLFGQDFQQGASVLIILAVGQFINVFTGSVGYLLMMTGRELIFKQLTLWSMAFLLVASIILIRSYGIVGAAIAYSLTISGMNVVSAWLVKRELGVQAIPLLGGRK